MNRFTTTKDSRFPALGIFLSAVIFLILLGLFFWGVRSISSTTAAEEKTSLENSIVRSVVHCYAVEGRYPESLSYLEDHYGITYNHDKFMVDYEVFASNLMPQITVIPLSTKEGS
jgi:hypothetical protein